MRLHAEHKYTGLRSSVFALENGFEPNSFLSGDGSGMLCQWQLDEPDRAHALLSLSSQIFALRLIFDKQLIAIGTMAGQLFFYDTVERRLHATAHQFNGAIFDIVEFQGNILVACESGELVYLDQELQLVKKQKVSRKSIRQLVVVSDTELFFASSDHQIHQLDLSKNTRPAIIAHQNSVFSLAYLESRQELWSGSRDAQLGVHILKEETDSEMIAAHLSTINSIAFSESEKHVMTGGRDKAIKLWEAESRKLLQVVHPEKGVGHSHSVNALLWSSTNKYLISGSDDRSIMLWSLH